MAKLTIARGLPGSGKTTWAKAQRDAWRVNRDDLRAMCNTGWVHGHPLMEDLITKMQYDLVRQLLRAGKHTIVDDTNLDWRHVRALIKWANDSVAGLDVEVKEFLHVPVEVCIERDAARPNPVGATVIMDMYRRYMGDVDG